MKWKRSVLVHVCQQYTKYINLSIKVSISNDKGHDFLDKAVSIWHTHWGGDLILPLFDNCETLQWQGNQGLQELSSASPQLYLLYYSLY